MKKPCNGAGGYRSNSFQHMTGEGMFWLNLAG